MHFPGIVAKKIFPRLVGLGVVLIMIGGALIYFRETAKAGIHLEQPMLVGLVCIVLGVLLITIAVMALILQQTWEFKGVKIRSRTAIKEISFNKNDPELTDMDMDVDEEDEEFQKSTRFKRGDTLEIELKIKALKQMEILRANCTLLVKHRSKMDLDRTRTVYRNSAEDVSNRNRMIRQNHTLTFQFEQRLPVDQNTSSYNDIWKLRLGIKAKGTTDFLQDIPLNIN